MTYLKVLAEQRTPNRTVVVERQSPDALHVGGIVVKTLTSKKFRLEQRALDYCKEEYGLEWEISEQSD